MISVIVLSKNNGDTLDKCLRSIIESEGKKEIIVVDAHSTDNTPQILRKYHGKIKVVYDEGKGVGIARNIGVKHSKGDIICFVDADAFCSKDHFIKIEEFFKRNPHISFLNVIGRAKTSKNPSFVERMEVALRYSRRILESDLSLASACFMAFRREVFRDVDGFWEIPYGAEDLDFSMKALANGWRMGTIETDSWYVPRKSFKELFKEMCWWAKGKACWVKKWRNHPLAKRMYENRRAFRILGRDILCYTLLAYLSAPFTAIKYLRITKSLSLYLFCILRQYAYLLGFIWGLTTRARKMRLACVGK